ncbi:hypothetical protein, partial [Anaplasma phagocytophilum]|uniref:hypothetical protein n=1 Tax=Anaplasma phagocytophilum TaxID=948 RepID=UPI001E598554
MDRPSSFFCYREKPNFLREGPQSRRDKKEGREFFLVGLCLDCKSFRMPLTMRLLQNIIGKRSIS